MLHTRSQACLCRVQFEVREFADWAWFAERRTSWQGHVHRNLRKVSALRTTRERLETTHSSQSHCSNADIIVRGRIGLRGGERRSALGVGRPTTTGDRIRSAPELLTNSRWLGRGPLASSARRGAGSWRSGEQDWSRPPGVPPGSGLSGHSTMHNARYTTRG